MPIQSVLETRDAIVEAGLLEPEQALELAITLEKQVAAGASERSETASQFQAIEAHLTRVETKVDSYRSEMAAYREETNAKLDAHQAETSAKLADQRADNEQAINRVQLFILGTGAVIIGVVGILMAVT